MRKLKLLFVLLFILLLFSLKNISADSNEIIIYDFYRQGCPHCDALNHFLEKEQEKNPDLIVKKYDIEENRENVDLILKMAKAFDVELKGVPAVFIDSKVIVGFSNSIKENLKEEIQRCSIEKCGDPINKIKTNETTQIEGDSSPINNNLNSKITIPAVIGAAAVDAINPCAFAVLIILVGTILSSGSRKRALFAGLFFSLSIYISYFLMGVGLYSAVNATGITHTFYFIVAILAIIVGLFNLKDYFWYGKFFVMEVPLKWRPRMKCLIKGITSVPGAFLIGFAVSLFLLPCTSGPYIVILGLLSKAATKNTALILLLLYNLVFILPMILITLFIYFGFTTTEKAEEWRKKNLRILHLISGIIIFLLGVGMLIAISLGMV